MRLAKKIFFDLPGMGRVHSESGSFQLAGEKRTGEKSDLGSSGYSEEYQNGKISLKVLNLPGVSAEALHAIVDATITVVDDNGKTYVCTRAFSTELPTLSDGMWDCEFEFAQQSEEL